MERATPRAGVERASPIPNFLPPASSFSLSLSLSLSLFSNYFVRCYLNLVAVFALEFVRCFNSCNNSVVRLSKRHGECQYLSGKRGRIFEGGARCAEGRHEFTPNGKYGESRSPTGETGRDRPRN